MSHSNSGPEELLEPVPLLCPSLDDDLVMQTMAIEMLKRWYMNSKMATKQRSARVRRHEPKSAGTAAGGADVVRVRPDKSF